MSFVIHIGSHKTGTTAVQRFAAAHRATLRERGLWYPSYAEIGRSKHYAHHHFAHAVAGAERDGFSFDDARRFARAVGQGRRRGETVLISAEPIYRHVVSEPGDYWDRREAYARRLREVVDADDVAILLVVRRQDGFARSLFQEKVKSRRYAANFRQFLVEQRHEFEYHRQLEVFARVFATVRLLVFEDILPSGLVDTFFARLGVDVSDLPRVPAENTSLPLELVEYKRLLNATGIGAAKLKSVAEKLENRARAGRLRNHVDWISRRDMETFCASFDVENERLRRDFAPDHPAPIFPSLDAAPIDEADEYEGMSAHRFAELTAEIFL